MKIPTLLFLAILLFSCGNSNNVYNQDITFPQSGWTYDNIIDFKFDIADTSATYEIELGIDFSDEYSFQNVYIRTNTIFPSTENFPKVLSFDLADKGGQWRGDCSNGTCNARFQLQKNARFPEMGTYTIQLEQFMRIDTLPNLEGLSLSIRTNEVKE